MNLAQLLLARPRQSLLLLGRDSATLLTTARFAACELLGDQRPSRKVHPDYIELNLVVEKSDAIRALVDKVQYPPFEGHRSVYALLGADHMEPSGANALLKTLEEPPPHVTFLLTCNNPSRLLPTILSRVFRYNVSATEDRGISNVANSLLRALKNKDPKDLQPFFKLDNLRELLEDAAYLADNSKDTAFLIGGVDNINRFIGAEPTLLALHRLMAK